MPYEIVAITSDGVEVTPRAHCICECQCTSRNHCDGWITAEDLLCDYCRKMKGRFHCHILAFLMSDR